MGGIALGVGLTRTSPYKNEFGLGAGCRTSYVRALRNVYYEPPPVPGTQSSQSQGGREVSSGP